MRRSLTVRKGKRTGDIRKDLSAAQLAGIGSVALAYNEVEVLIDLLTSMVLGLFNNTGNEVMSRINGVDGKIELAKIGMRELAADKTIMDLLGQTLGEAGFKEYKKYRDAVVHARILDAPAGIALSPAKRGKIDEVLLTVDALNGLYDRLALVRLELIEALNVGLRLFAKQRLKVVGETTVILLASQPDDRAGQIADLPKRQYEQEIQADLSRYREHQKRRLSLPPLPEFPDESLILLRTAKEPVLGEPHE